MKKTLSILLAATMVTSVANASRGKGKEGLNRASKITLSTAKKTANTSAIYKTAKDMKVDSANLSSMLYNGKLDTRTIEKTVTVANTKLGTSKVSATTISRAADTLAKDATATILLADAINALNSNNFKDKSLARAYVKSILDTTAQEASLDKIININNMDTVSEKLISENISVRDIANWGAAKEQYIRLMAETSRVMKTEGLNRTQAEGKALENLKDYFTTDFKEKLAKCKKK